MRQELNVAFRQGQCWGKASEAPILYLGALLLLTMHGTFLWAPPFASTPYCHFGTGSAEVLRACKW